MPTQTECASLDERRRAANLTVADLARRTRVAYRRLWPAVTGGARLTKGELARIETVLTEAEATDTNGRHGPDLVA